MCPVSEDPVADPCALLGEAACKEPCRWFEAVRFLDCGSACGATSPVGVCVGLEGAPETGCTGPCWKSWRETPGGLELFAGEFCFEFPVAWKSCFSYPHPGCECGCTPPP
jgi:hypothetical protein